MRLISTNPLKNGLEVNLYSNNEQFHWNGRIDHEDGDKGLRWHQVIKPSTHLSDFALLGFNCDLGVAANKGRIGAKAGPNAIKAALSNLAWHLPHSIRDLGNVVAQQNLEKAQHSYARQVNTVLTTSAFVMGLGGGHEIAYASYLGLHKHVQSHSNNKIGIINFDAHFDLRLPSPNASSGTPFFQISKHCAQHSESFQYACLGVAKPANTEALFARAKALNVLYLLDEECEIEAAKALLIPMLEQVDELYLTVCLDAFPSSIAPGVSAPSSFGISLRFVLAMIRWLSTQQSSLGFNWRLMDIAEMNPSFDIDSRTAKLAARLVFEALQAKSLM